MNSRITIELTPGDALLALGAVQDRATESSRLAAIATGEEHEIAMVSFQSLSRTAARLSSALYPDCFWAECDRPAVTGDRYCPSHALRVAVPA